MWQEHPTVEVDGVPIDREIAPLIRALWELEIATLNSCQDNHGRVWIEFASAADAEDFLDRVAVYEGELDTLYNRIRGEWEPLDYENWRERDAWWYSALPHDLSVDQELTEDDEIEETCTGPPQFIFSVSVRFPRRDLPSVVERIGSASRAAALS